MDKISFECGNLSQASHYQGKIFSTLIATLAKFWISSKTATSAASKRRLLRILQFLWAIGKIMNFLSLEWSFVRSVVDLIPNGSNQQVSFEERERYIDLVYERRLKEHELQIQTLRKGMGKIIPLQIINFLSWKELEVLVCGSSSISRELLKRHTVYGSGIDPSDECNIIFKNKIRKYLRVYIPSNATRFPL